MTFIRLLAIHFSVDSFNGLAQNENSYSPLTQELARLAERFCRLAERRGISINPTHSSFKIFNSLPLEKKEGIYKGFSTYMTWCERALSDGAATDDRTFAWWVLKELKFKFSSDLFGHLGPKDVIEIYNIDSVQIFRSFNFFHLVSYTLEEIFCYEWWQLYTRPQAINDEMWRMGELILKTKESNLVFGCVPEHTVEEVFSEKMNHARVSEKLLAPLYDCNDQVAGFLHSFEVVDIKSMAAGKGN